MILRRLGPPHDPVENVLVRDIEHPLELPQAILVEGVEMRLAERPHEQVELAKSPSAGPERTYSALGMC